MQKIFFIILSIIIIFSNTTSLVKAEETQENEVQLNINAPSSILIEYSTGKILYSKDINKKMYPASMTKMMAIYLFLESIETGSHSFEEIVTVSSLASGMGGSQIFLKEHEQMTFKDLFTAVTVASANDATVALAEQTYGSIDSFVKEMNTRSKNFGMNNTNFVNITGFHDPNHYTTAYDMAILARKLLKDYKDILLPYTSTYDTYLRQETSSPFWLVNTNRMIKYYNGMDGLKTGYTSDSGFNLTATALRNDFRLISVVMGGKTSKSRNQDTTTLLDYGFNTYKSINLYKKGEVISTVDFNNAKTIQNEIVANEDINVIIKKNITLNDLLVSITYSNLDSPKSSQDVIGTITIRDKNNNVLATYNLYPKYNIEKLSFWDLLIKFLKLII